MTEYLVSQASTSHHTAVPESVVGLFPSQDPQNQCSHDSENLSSTSCPAASASVLQKPWFSPRPETQIPKRPKGCCKGVVPASWKMQKWQLTVKPGSGKQEGRVATVANQKSLPSKGDSTIAGTASVEPLVTEHLIFWKKPKIWGYMYNLFKNFNSNQTYNSD